MQKFRRNSLYVNHKTPGKNQSGLYISGIYYKFVNFKSIYIFKEGVSFCSQDKNLYNQKVRYCKTFFGLKYPEMSYKTIFSKTCVGTLFILSPGEKYVDTFLVQVLDTLNTYRISLACVARRYLYLALSLLRQSSVAVPRLI